MPRGRHRSVSTATRISLLAAICAPALVAVVLAVVAGGANTLRIAVLLGVSSAVGAVAWVVRGSTAHQRRLAEESIARRRERERMAGELRLAVERAEEHGLVLDVAAEHLTSRPQQLTPDLFARASAVLDLLDRRGGGARPTAPSIVPAVRRPPVSSPDLVRAYAASVFGPGARSGARPPVAPAAAVAAAANEAVRGDERRVAPAAGVRAMPEAGAAPRAAGTPRAGSASESAAATAPGSTAASTPASGTARATASESVPATASTPGFGSARAAGPATEPEAVPVTASTPAFGAARVAESAPESDAVPASTPGFGKAGVPVAAVDAESGPEAAAMPVAGTVRGSEVASEPVPAVVAAHPAAPIAPPTELTRYTEAVRVAEQQPAGAGTTPEAAAPVAEPRAAEAPADVPVTEDPADVPAATEAAAHAPGVGSPASVPVAAETAEVTRMVRDKVLEVTRRVAGAGASGRFDFFAPRAPLAEPEATGFLTDELFGSDARYDALIAGRPHVDPVELADVPSETDDIEADRIADPVHAEAEAPAAQPAPVHRGQGVRFAPTEPGGTPTGATQRKPLPVDLTAHDDTEEIPRIDIRKHA
ncbi:hypothetical protein [Embleya sp. MST-111070]|uniref:hypothetical protein n=1 Tax=Embleya sp. MST-111070 TaxID=3398231 RepID=UPI003F73F27E